MRIALRIASLVVLCFLVACASSEVKDYHPYQGSIPRPDRIIVYDIATTPADLPPFASVGTEGLPTTPQTADQLALGHRLGAEIAQELVSDLQQMGLPAVRGAADPEPRVGDAMVVGYFTSVDAGSAVERVVVGFGTGAAKLVTVVRGYLMTDDGVRALGSGDVDAGSGEMPGAVVPLAVTLATANPVGLVVGGAVKAYGEVSGSDTIEGAARRTAADIADKIKATAERQGWIS